MGAQYWLAECQLGITPPWSTILHSSHIGITSKAAPFCCNLSEIRYLSPSKRFAVRHTATTLHLLGHPSIDRACRKKNTGKSRRSAADSPTSNLPPSIACYKIYL